MIFTNHIYLLISMPGHTTSLAQKCPCANTTDCVEFELTTNCFLC